jgi:hypothetical protein
MNDEDISKYRDLAKRLRALGEQMNAHGRDEDAFAMYAAEVDKITAEMGRLTGADQDPEWPKGGSPRSDLH